MSELVQKGRYAAVTLQFNGKEVDKEIDPYLMDFTYNDGYSGQADDITIQLDDRDRKWIKEWVPVHGDEIKADILIYHWDKYKEKLKLPCGKFYLKSFTYGGKPDTITMEASALPVEGNKSKQEKRSKSWEKTQLKTVAGEIAKRAKLSLVYEASSNPSYERLDMTEQTDFEFLLGIAVKEGITIKVSGAKLVLFNEEKFEKAEAAFDIVHGEDDVLSYEFESNSENAAYGSCEVVYTIPKSKKEPAKTVKGVYKLPRAGDMPVLRVNKSVETVAEANRLAKNSLREQNKKAGRARITMSGHTRYAAGLTINIKGWGYFDGKYIIEAVNHRISANAAYTVDLDIRKVLGW